MNLGKRFPGVPYPRVQNFTQPYFIWPPRKLILKCWQYQAPGAKAAAWFNVETMSTLVAMVSPTSDRFFYEWTPAADATQKIRAEIWFTCSPGSTILTTTYIWNNVFTHYVSGVAWGSGSALTNTNQIFASGGGYGGALTIGPPTPPQPADWTSANFVMRCAEWADMPDYHPYRH